MLDVKAWRKAKGITQEQAASLLGITPRHYQRLEAGDCRLTETMERLLQLL